MAELVSFLASSKPHLVPGVCRGVHGGQPSPRNITCAWQIKIGRDISCFLAPFGTGKRKPESPEQKVFQIFVNWKDGGYWPVVSGCKSKSESQEPNRKCR